MSSLADRTHDDAEVSIEAGGDEAGGKGLTVLAKYGVDAWREWLLEQESA